MGDTIHDLLAAAAPVYTQQGAYPSGMKKGEVDDMIKHIQANCPKVQQDACPFECRLDSHS
ncbi:hypothetical protein [Terribacillus sp. 7520-G]|uniref:hypothetical protein n=1 Tax=Terribacillus TaxID=459532 RepID=UPI000BA6861D|nr:hypothetical protein [Terribacillus sp. 7520-G]PAD37908.1 hypothetical protein CHH53_13680 [Terribacillus sp. 7520-G]